MPKPTRITVTDALGDELVLEALPQRIVSLVPSITETLIELGVGERLVGITTYCVYPEDVVARIPKVGATKGFSFDKVAALEPDLVIANKEENRRRHVDKVRQCFPVFVTYPRDVAGAIAMIRDLGILTGTSQKAGEFADQCEAALASVEGSAYAPLRTACLIWRDPWMVAGPDSYMSELLRSVGFENVYGPADGRYPETTLDEIAARSPDVVILPSEPYEFGDVDRDEIASFFGRAETSPRILLMDGSYLTWFGTRTLRALKHLIDTRERLETE